MNFIKVACGTDDGVNYSNNHFGSAKYYLIYKLNLLNGDVEFIKRVNNSSVEERTHGDPLKAKSITKLLSGVKVLIGKAMGLNINRMRKRFIPVISRVDDINESLVRLKEVLSDIKSNLLIPDGVDKNIIYLNK